MAAGGTLLVATAPNRSMLTIGLAVTLAAAARAARGLDALVLARARPHRHDSVALPDPRVGGVTALIAAVAGGAGLGAVVLVGHLWGTGTGLTVLVPPVAAAAVLCCRRMSRPAVAGVMVQGGRS